MINRECPVCGKTYEADPGRLKHGRQTTCSRACSYELRKRKLTTSEEATCPVCQKVFVAYQSRLNGAKYTPVCSTECLYKGRSLGIIKRTVDKPYDVTDEGRKAWKESGQKRKGIPYKTPVSFICENCGKTKTINRGDLKPGRKLRFCSQDCANQWNCGENNSQWRGGYEAYYGPTWKRQRRLARKRDNYTCQDCRITEQEKGKQHDVHHIKRFADFTDPNEANQLENLITLCHVCHMKREQQDYPGYKQGK